jgi:hypothetical protein
MSQRMSQIETMQIKTQQRRSRRKRYLVSEDPPSQ